MRKFHVGDPVVRVMPPTDTYEADVNTGHVSEVTEDVITCQIRVDVIRTMHFSAKNGLDLAGIGSFLLPHPYILSLPPKE